MSKQLNVYMEWLESVGYSPYVWLRGDWHQPLHLLSKLLAEQLKQRRPMNSADDVVFKIGFNAMLQLAEETLGIPCLITERDLMIHYPNIILSMLVYLICVKHSVDFIDTKSLRNIVAPKLVFEARNAGDAQLPKCASCSEHVFIIERVVIEACVWHRHCFKCVQCNAVMKIGGFRKSKRGYECISHAVRRILHVMEEKKCTRPRIAPPEVPLASTSAIESTLKKNALKSSIPPPISPKPKLSLTTIRKPSPPPKPAGLSVSKEQNTTTISQGLKPSELISDYEIISVGSENFGDSGVELRTQKLFVDADTEGYQIVSQLQSTSPHTTTTEVNTPVPPPRPKRASLMLTNAVIERKLDEDSISSRALNTVVKSTTDTLDIASLGNENELDSQTCSSWLVTQDYQDNSCALVERDEIDNELRNPFADSDDDCETSSTHALSRTLTPASVLPGESDRPKCTPPPPPIMSSSFSDKSHKNAVNIEERFRTLNIPKKPIRTLHPPLAMCGKVMFAEKMLEGTREIERKLEPLDVNLARLLREGKQLEVEMLFLITQNPSDWLKMPRTEDFIEVMCRFLDMIRESNTLQFMWRVAFLNEIHSETEHHLRRIIGKDLQDDESIEREKQLMNLLIFIIDEKAKLSEESISDRPVDTNTTKKRELQNLKHELRLALLSKGKQLVHMTLILESILI